MLSTVVGASAGVIIRVWANALERTRLFARPWNHIGMAMIGGYIGYNLHSWEDRLLVAVNEKRVEKGMLPIKRQNIVTLPIDKS